MNLQKNIILLLSSTILLTIFTGCSSKNEIEEYNKPAAYWYDKIVDSVANSELEHADSAYSSLQSEHAASPFLPEATFMLAIAHLHNEEYLLSEHFLDEYLKRYANLNEKENAEFLKIKAKYLALPLPRRDQALINEAIEQAELFKRDYPASDYVDIVDHMLTRLYLAQFVLNDTIVDLYERIDKPESAKHYRENNKQKWILSQDISRAVSPWYRAWFEGDGASSWYDFMIPDTQSVVSRNSVKNDANKPVQEEKK
jgi:outer membrane protein assembly factor BamD